MVKPRLFLLLLVVGLGGLGALARFAVTWGGTPSAVSLAMPPPPAERPSGGGNGGGGGRGNDSLGADGPYANFKPGADYPLNLWERDEALAGEVNHVSIAGPRPAALDARALAPGDSLLISGWAGEPVVGMRASYVLFSMCGRVFAAAPVDERRPDIRRFVHRNLLESGWSARLAVAALPTCGPDRASLLRVWAARDNRILYPLEGVTALTPPEVPPGDVAESVAASVTAFSGQPAMRPEDFPPLERRTVTVAGKEAVLRRCPGTDCHVLGRIPVGTHDAVLLDHTGRWTLLVVGTQAGWLADEAFTLPEEG